MAKTHSFLLVMIDILFVAGCATTPPIGGVKKGPEGINAASEIASRVSARAESLPNRRVAVVEFSDITGEESLSGKLLAERIITKLVEDATVSVVERSQVKKILEEQKFEISGVVDSSTAKEMGKFLGVDAIVSGTIANLGETNEINARMIDTENGLILAACSVQESVDSELAGMQKEHPEEVDKLARERDALVKLKKSNPQEYKITIARKKALVKLQKEDPQLFRALIKLRKELLRLAKKNPQQFLLFTSPKFPPGLQRKSPKLLRRAKKIRKHLPLLKKHLPLAYRKIMAERKKLLRREKKKITPKGPPGKRKRR